MKNSWTVHLISLQIIIWPCKSELFRVIWWLKCPKHLSKWEHIDYPLTPNLLLTFENFVNSPFNLAANHNLALQIRAFSRYLVIKMSETFIKTLSDYCAGNTSQILLVYSRRKIINNYRPMIPLTYFGRVSFTVPRDGKVHKVQGRVLDKLHFLDIRINPVG